MNGIHIPPLSYLEWYGHVLGQHETPACRAQERDTSARQAGVSRTSHQIGEATQVRDRQSLTTRQTSRVSLAHILEGYVTKFAPHKALKSNA